MDRILNDLNEQQQMPPVPEWNPFCAPGYTALHFAVEHHQLHTARVLLRHGANVCLANSKHETPLHLAFKLGSEPLVDLLLKHNTQYEDLRDDSGLTHFMCACASSRVGWPRKFLVAARSRSRQAAQALLDARVGEGPLSGYSAQEIARLFGRRQTVQLLQRIRQYLRSAITSL